MLVTKYDVIIIGGGPAGSSMAGILADAGVSVLVVEKRRKIGSPVQCAEFIQKAGYDGPREFIAQTIGNMVTHLSDRSIHVSKSPGYTIQRDLYDQFLAEKAINKGATYLTHSFGIIKNGIAAVKLHDNSIRTYKPKVVANASGGIRAKHAAFSRQVTLPLEASVKDIHVWLDSKFAGGYAWLFPKRDRANVGLAVTKRNGKSGLKEMLDSFISSIKSEFALGTKILSTTGGRIPVSGPGPLIEDNVLAIGDAAGVVHPVSGEGIYRAIRSGRIAGEATASFIRTGKKEKLEDYAEFLMDIFSHSFKRDTKKRAEWEEAIINGGPTVGEYKKLWIAFPEYYKKEQHAKVQS
tara:strand:- start:9081 stop:10133 length:1053 start_codon:yes stop_codon:yes gene_type:complete